MPDRDTTDIEEIRTHIEELATHAAALEEQGREADIPAVERNAKRVEDTVAMLEMNIPAELSDK